jgi:hypothetical protein
MFLVRPLLFHEILCAQEATSSRLRFKSECKIISKSLWTHISLYIVGLVEGFLRLRARYICSGINREKIK